MERGRGPDPHVEGARLAARAFGPLALRALDEVQAALSALERGETSLHGASLRSWLEFLATGQRAAGRAAAFLTRALPLLEPDAADRRPTRGLVRYAVPGRATLDFEGGCTAAGWRARVEAQRLAGVRALHLALSVALLDDLELLAGFGEQLDEFRPAVEAAQVEAFHEGLSHLAGLVELLGDAQRVVCTTAPDGRQMMDLFKSAEPV